MNYATFRDATIKLLNVYSASGNLTPISDSSVQDAVLRFPAFVNICQNEIATTTKYIHKKKIISQNPIPNMLSNPYATFDIQAFLGIDLVDMVAQGAQSYNFEVDNLATIYIEEEVNGVWQVLPIPVEINNTVKGQYTIYKGFIVPSNPTNNVRVRFSGLYPYNIRNKALFAYTWSSTDDMPIYQRYSEYIMPDDFFNLMNVVDKGNNIKWEFKGRNIIAIDYFLVGEVDIQYYAYPTEVSDPSIDSFIFDLDEEACQCMAFYVASQVLIDDPINKSVGARLFDIYQGKLANLTNVITQGTQSVTNTMFKLSESSQERFLNIRNLRQ
jgi:hypothetical protein